MRLKDLTSMDLSTMIFDNLVQLGLYTENCVAKDYFIEKARYYFTRKSLYATLKYVRKCVREGRSSQDMCFNELPIFDSVIRFINAQVYKFTKTISCFDLKKISEVV